ncbi:MAG: hypothetical protein M1542_03040 [Thermotogae bacterium]|jgi:hypothetical protein|nr:hypothetical protein [Thermotogota bacterium]MCL5032213.1 hypothetical protein [Thermotogota bacterium]
MEVNGIGVWRVDLGKKIFWLKNSVQNSSGYFEIWDPISKNNENFKDKAEKQSNGGTK